MAVFIFLKIECDSMGGKKRKTNLRIKTTFGE